MNADQPHFRFNPGAYGEGRSFERSAQTCDVCSRPCVWRYSAGLYSIRKATVCARCIADASLSGFLAGERFTLQDAEVGGARPELEAEVMQRTPGVSSFNAFDWPVLNGTPLVFIGYGEELALLALPDVIAAIKEAFAEIGWRFEGPTPYAMIFKEIAGDRYRVVVDLD